MKTELERIIVEPGECFFSQLPLRMTTVLGSCVALTCWHPKLYVGGMCHYLLPHENSLCRKNKLIYGDYALQTMKHYMLGFSALDQYEIGVFGGSSMLKDQTLLDVGAKNIHLLTRWLQDNNVSPVSTSLGGHFSRRVELNIANGQVSLSENEF